MIKMEKTLNFYNLCDFLQDICVFFSTPSKIPHIRAGFDGAYSKNICYGEI